MTLGDPNITQASPKVHQVTLMEPHFGVIGETQQCDLNPDYPDLFAHIEAGFLSI